MGSFALPLLLFGALYVFFILPQSRRRKQTLALQRAVEPGSRVILTSGLYGTVVEIDDEAVVLEAAEGVQLRYAKAAVLRVIPEADSDDEQDSEFDEFEEDLAGNDGVDDLEKLDGVDGQTPEVPDEPDADVPPSTPPDRFTKRFSKRPPKADGNDAGSGPVPSS